MKKTRPPVPAQKRAYGLLQQRRRLLDTEFNAVGHGFFGLSFDGTNVERNADMTAAIAAWRERRLAEIDARLHELGISDIAALEARLAAISEDCRARQMAAISEALANEVRGRSCCPRRREQEVSLRAARSPATVACTKRKAFERPAALLGKRNYSFGVNDEPSLIPLVPFKSLVRSRISYRRPIQHGSVGASV